MEKVKCFVSNNLVDESRAIKGSYIRDTIFKFIEQTYPEFTRNDYLSRTEFDKIRRAYLYNLMSVEYKDLTKSEKSVVDSITNNKILSENIEPLIESEATIGERAANHLTEFGGSWKFVISFLVVLFIWIIANVILFSNGGFDPYPFRLLNLVLTCLAAIQAPIIMMSQNRLGKKDRLRSENNYKINLKAELEIKLLHEKIDNIFATQQEEERFYELQKMQMDYLEEILYEIRHTCKPSNEEVY